LAEFNPWLYADVLDQLGLANPKGQPIASPGLLELGEVKQVRVWQKYPAYGVTGEVAIFLRVLLAEFTVKFKLYEEQDLKQWEAFKPLLLQIPARDANGKEPKYLEIYHPFLKELGIVAVGVAEISTPVPIDNGGWMRAVKFLEYKGLPKNTLSKPEATVVGPPDPDQQQLADALARKEQVQALARRNRK
jgi:hypothetical protein